MVKFKNDIKQTTPTQRQKHLRSVFSFKLAETVPVSGCSAYQGHNDPLCWNIQPKYSSFLCQPRTVQTEQKTSTSPSQQNTKWLSLKSIQWSQQWNKANSWNLTVKLLACNYGRKWKQVSFWTGTPPPTHTHSLYSQSLPVDRWLNNSIQFFGGECRGSEHCSR